MASQPRVLLFGVGSVGAVYLHQLQRAGCFVTAVCRSNYAAVEKNGFTLISEPEHFGTVSYRPDQLVRSVADCPSYPPYDYVLVTAKSFPGSRPSLPEQIRPAIEGRPQTAIVLAQNGIDIEFEVAEAFPQNPILSAVVYLPAMQTEPGIVHLPEMLNRLELGTFPAHAPASHKSSAAAFAELMRRGGGRNAGSATVLDDIQVARWSKLLLNASWNPICALSLCTDGDFLLTSQPFARDLVWGVMLEIIGLARRIGIAGIDEKVAEKQLSIALRRADLHTGRAMSMLQDVRQNRPFEVEAIVGNAVRLGRRWGFPMPRLETIYALARARYEALIKHSTASDNT